MPHNVVDSPADEKKWQRAVEIAKEQGKPEAWGLIMHIYKNMKPDHEFEKAARRIANRAYLASFPGQIELVSYVVEPLNHKGWAVTEWLKVPQLMLNRYFGDVNGPMPGRSGLRDTTDVLPVRIPITRTNDIDMLTWPAIAKINDKVLRLNRLGIEPEWEVGAADNRILPGNYNAKTEILTLNFLLRTSDGQEGNWRVASTMESRIAAKVLAETRKDIDWATASDDDITEFLDHALARIHWGHPEEVTVKRGRMMTVLLDLSREFQNPEEPGEYQDTRATIRIRPTINRMDYAGPGGSSIYPMHNAPLQEGSGATVQGMAYLLQELLIKFPRPNFYHPDTPSLDDRQRREW